MFECKKCIIDRIEQLQRKILEFPEALMCMFWRRELESLQNRRDIVPVRKDCCK